MTNYQPTHCYDCGRKLSAWFDEDSGPVPELFCSACVPEDKQE